MLYLASYWSEICSDGAAIGMSKSWYPLLPKTNHAISRRLSGTWVRNLRCTVTNRLFQLGHRFHTTYAEFQARYGVRYQTIFQISSLSQDVPHAVDLVWAFRLVGVRGHWDSNIFVCHIATATNWAWEVLFYSANRDCLALTDTCAARTPWYSCWYYIPSAHARFQGNLIFWCAWHKLIGYRQRVCRRINYCGT